MRTYRYEGMNDEGQEVGGMLEAESEADATSALRSQGFFVTRLNQVSDSAATAFNRETKSADPEKMGCSVGILVLGIVSVAVYFGL